MQNGLNNIEAKVIMRLPNGFRARQLNYLPCVLLENKETN
jgi:hypothetical protein